MQQVVHRKLQRLAFDVPQREVERAQRVRLLTPRRVEPRDVGFLPDRFGAERILADQRAGALLERVLGTAFAEACDPDVGLDGDDHVALIEERVEVRRPVVAEVGIGRPVQGLADVPGQPPRARHGGGAAAVVRICHVAPDYRASNAQLRRGSRTP